ncbi:aminotransferase class I/II-fold pyridoxal phosphate-dependent enzyme [Sneathiella sp. P13V-1]|uniref:aminotransferase-like domain-containing protein n=1 Tax=Sneathiella sp. P13V-1 TaxID=2697366 RepID=UPI00187B8473|nr:PLP-dependent aminotransferase family protein [Sneathiella sp. P13V-1]MBE7638014.1 aminotransferase class I/II-fold pyridoxal phosphate-dependent enzyme [Sneathiella sp. P13V-1]
MKAEDVVEHIRKQISEGALKAGDRLPTHRDLAWDLKCSIGTVSRGYAELERRGITVGQVGRGTYVAPFDPQSNSEAAHLILPTLQLEAESPEIDLAVNRFYHSGAQRIIQKALSSLSLKVPQFGYQSYIDSKGRDEDRIVGAEWLTKLTGPVSMEEVMVTQGAQSALFVTLGALTKPGDAIATECLGYPGIKAAAHALKLKVIPIAMDKDGMCPTALDQAISRSHITAIVTVPTNQNPTGVTVPALRRHLILDLAKRHDLPVIEDGVYSPFHEGKEPTYRELDPEQAIYLTSFSKVFNPSLRVGYIAASSKYMRRLADQMTAMSWMTSPILLDLANMLVRDGTIARHQADLIKSGKRRYAKACEILKPWLPDIQLDNKPFLSHLWVPVPQELALTEMVERARERDVILIGGDRFAVNRQQDDHFVRICLMGVPDEERLYQALNVVKEILEEATEGELIS